MDRSVFKPTPSDFRERHGIGDRFIVLGVASPWTERKGLGDFVHLARNLDSKNFVVVLVGLNDREIKKYLGLDRSVNPTAKSQRLITEVNSLADYKASTGNVRPKDEGCEMVILRRTESKAALAEIYSAADVFVNPTIEDNFPTVNLEAEACGTPVITYNTGGCSETIANPRSRCI